MSTTTSWVRRQSEAEAASSAGEDERLARESKLQSDVSVEEVGDRDLDVAAHLVNGEHEGALVEDLGSLRADRRRELRLDDRSTACSIET